MTFPLLGCETEKVLKGGFIDQHYSRGHQISTLQKHALNQSHDTQYTTQVLIIGAGVTGFSAARALRQRGLDDFMVLELDSRPGGNSKGSLMADLHCPLGAHYLPVPSDQAHEVQDFLEEIGIRKRMAGRWMIEDKHLCHSPQERLYIDNHWQEGLLPLDTISETTLKQYHRFHKLVEEEQKKSNWQIPIRNLQRDQNRHNYLATISYSEYLLSNAINDEYLIWYLNYCCLDEYGADINKVSAWAGLHYFTSRHGFIIPGLSEKHSEGVLTWPEGNAWLINKIFENIEERVSTGQIVFQIEQHKHYASVLVLNTNNNTIEKWIAKKIIIASPIKVAAKIVNNPRLPLQKIAAGMDYAPWLVANISMNSSLLDNEGMAPSWDNVIYGKKSLGYVDATHQLLSEKRKSSLITYYHALGYAKDLNKQRLALLKKPWTYWCDSILFELGTCHPDLREKINQIDITRYGHGMVIPKPNSTGKISYSWNDRNDGRIVYAHSDWAGYSIFEEAFTLGFEAGIRI
jgi:protoporphyrinogen oxidase